MGGTMGLKQRWGTFLSILFDPWVLILTGATLLLFFVSSNRTAGSDPALIAILNVLLTLSSGLLGGIVAKYWLDVSETTVLVARGKTAIRSLKLLLNNIDAFEKTADHYIKRQTSDAAKMNVVGCS